MSGTVENGKTLKIENCIRIQRPPYDHALPERADVYPNVDIRKPSVDISRPVFDLATFDKRYGSRYVDLSVAARFKRFSKTVCHSPGSYLKQTLLTCFPPIEWLQEYEWRKGILCDIIAGFVVGIMNIPQGMAYGILAGLPPQYGLYTSLFPPLLYALFGTSKHISFGTFAVISLMVSAVLEKNVISSPGTFNTTLSFSSSNLSSTPLGGVFHCSQPKRAASNSPETLEIAVAFTFVVGICQIILGLLHVGFIAVYLSDQLVEGLTAGAAVQVFTSQVSKLFGIRGLPSCSGIFGVVQFYVCFFANITRINWASLITSVICVSVLIVAKEFIEPPFKKRLKIPLPTELFLVIFGTLISHYCYLNNNYSVEIIGRIPTGIPAPRLPVLDHMMRLLPDAITMSIVGYSISVSMGKLFAKKHDYKIKPNQEWFALGFVHMISSFFMCHCSGSSLSRSAVQEGQGAKSQLASVFGALVVLIVVLVLAPLLKALPQCVLAAILIVNLKNTFKQFGNLPRLWKQSKIDFTEEIPHVKIYRFDSPLYFANAAAFKDELYRCTNLDPIEQKKQLMKNKNTNKVADVTSSNAIGLASFRKGSSLRLFRTDSRASSVAEQGIETSFGLRCIIVDCSSFPYVDLMGVDALKQVYEEYQKIGVQVMFASVKVAVRQLLDVCGFYKTIPKTALYLSIHDAVVAFSLSSSSIPLANADL